MDKLSLNNSKPIYTKPTENKGTAQVPKNNGNIKLNQTKEGFFKGWLNGKNRCTDGKDDGKLSFKEKIKSFGKGLLAPVKSIIKKPITSALVIGAAVGLTVLTGGAAAPFLVAAGAAIGAGQIGVGAYKAFKAKTDAEAKSAWENIGCGTLSVGLSALGAKSALAGAEKAGVTGAAGSEKLNMLQATAKCFKVVPEALKTGYTNAANKVANTINSLTAVKKGSPELQTTYGYMSKANDVKAYRFDPKGENPGVLKDAQGRFYVNNKWDPDHPHFIDPSKEQMIMMYDGLNDMAVCEGSIFKGSYVNTGNFKANGSLNYVDPSKLPYGEIIEATKQAPGSVKILPTGTKIKTLEGIQVIEPGKAVALDHAGNPYVSTFSNILSRSNIKFELLKNFNLLKLKQHPAFVDSFTKK